MAGQGARDPKGELVSDLRIRGPLRRYDGAGVRPRPGDGAREGRALPLHRVREQPYPPSLSLRRGPRVAVFPVQHLQRVLVSALRRQGADDRRHARARTRPRRALPVAALPRRSDPTALAMRRGPRVGGVSGKRSAGYVVPTLRRECAEDDHRRSGARRRTRRRMPVDHDQVQRLSPPPSLPGRPRVQEQRGQLATGQVVPTLPSDPPGDARATAKRRAAPPRRGPCRRPC